jgi:hypothetical protein
MSGSLISLWLSFIFCLWVVLERTHAAELWPTVMTGPAVAYLGNEDLRFDIITWKNLPISMLMFEVDRTRDQSLHRGTAGPGV